MEDFIVNITTHIGSSKNYIETANNEVEAAIKVLSKYKMGSKGSPPGIPRIIKIDNCSVQNTIYDIDDDDDNDHL